MNLKAQAYDALVQKVNWERQLAELERQIVTLQQALASETS